MEAVLFLGGKYTGKVNTGFFLSWLPLESRQSFETRLLYLMEVSRARQRSWDPVMASPPSHSSLSSSSRLCFHSRLWVVGQGRLFEGWMPCCLECSEKSPWRLLGKSRDGTFCLVQYTCALQKIAKGAEGVGRGPPCTGSYSVQDAVCRTSHTLSHLNLTVALWGRCDCLHFIHKESEA